MAFHFLSSIVKTAGHGIGYVAHGSSDPGGGIFGFLRNVAAEPANVTKFGVAKATGNQQAAQNAQQRIAQPVQTLFNADKAIIHGARDIGQGIIGAGIPIGVEAYNRVVAPIAHLPQQTFNPNQFGATGTTLLGNKPIQSPSQVFTSSREAGHGKPLSFLAGALTAAGAYPGGKAESELAQRLIKAVTAEDATKILVKSGVNEVTAKSIAPAIAKTKDPNIIRNIIDKAHTPPPSSAEIAATKAPAVVSPGQAPNRFLETIKNSPSTSQEAKDALKGLAETHPERNTIALSDAAKKTVDKNPDAALAKVLSAPSPSDTDVAEGIHVLSNLQREAKQLADAGDTAGAKAKLDQFHNVSEAMIQRATAGGRYTQAHAIMNSLSPEGVAYKAIKRVQDIRESNPKNIAKQNKTAQELQNQLEKPIGQKEVKQTLSDIAEGKPPKESLSTGEQLAKKVEKAASPQVKKKTDTLVQELTKKVKQEYLEPKPNLKKNPLDILKETFGRSEEAKKAYPEAQQILRDKYANDEKMSEALDKFFGSKLNLPAAKSTVNEAVRNQLKTQGDKISQIIYKSHIEQGNTVQQTANELVKEGFDPTSAKQLADEATKRLNQQIHEAKIAKLEQLAKESKGRTQSTYLDKLNKLSNLGALDKSDYLHLAQAKLNLPRLTSDEAKKISELSQKLQGLPEGHEKYAVIREIANIVHGSVPLTKGQILKNVPGLMRTIVASGDLSFGGRQGLSYLVAHPINFAKEWPKQFAYFKQAFKGGDSEAFDAMMADIKIHPDYQWLEKSGLAVLDPHAHLFNQREEQFIGTELADKIPGVRKLIDASAYAYTGFANSLRANQFYSMLELARRGGREPDEQFVKDLAEVINTSTGRGGLGKWGEEHAGALSTALFAPRLIASRVRTVLNPAIYIKADPIVRNEAIRQLLSLSAFGVGILGMAKMAGADVEVDPRSADFGKIKIGDTRIDILGGYTQYIRLGAQLKTGQKIDSTTGAQTEVGRGLAGSRFDILANFLENKSTPAIGLVVTELKGKDISGNSIYNAKGQLTQLGQRFIPLLFQDAGDLLSHPDALKGNNVARAGALLAGVGGVGLQTYGTQDLPVSGNNAKHLQTLQSQGAPRAQINAAKAFFQILKSAPARTTAYDRIHQAIDNGDYQKAEQLAQEYNASVDQHIQQSGWVDKYSQYIDSYLEKQYESTKINLTAQTIKQYLKSKEVQ